MIIDFLYFFNQKFFAPNLIEYVYSCIILNKTDTDSNFHLTHDDVKAEYYGLRIVDSTQPPEGTWSLSHFQQASLLLQFITPGPDGDSTIFHEGKILKVVNNNLV